MLQREARSAFEARRLIDPFPMVMDHLLQLHNLRKSVWMIINDSVTGSASLSVISPGCCLHTDGYAGLYTPDVQLWSMIHIATDVDSAKLTATTQRTVTSADLKKMLKDVLCSNNHFQMTGPDDSRFLLPRLAHYDGPLDPIHIATWLRDVVGMTPFMVHAYFRPFLC